MRRLLWPILAGAIAAACGAFEADGSAPKTAADAGPEATATPIDAAIEIEIPDEALDSGAGSADATAQSSPYGGVVIGDGPLAYWRMNLNDKGVVPNVIENGLALVPDDRAKVASVPGALPAETDGALELKGGLLGTAKSPLYDFAGDRKFTVECWARLTGKASGLMPIVAKATFLQLDLLGAVTNWDGYVLSFQGTSPSAIYGNGGKVDATGNGGPALDAWHHYVLVVDEEVRLFVDGAESAQRNIGFRPSKKENTPFLVGAMSGRLERFAGAIDEVALYDKALSAERIKAHFDQGQK